MFAKSVWMVLFTALLLSACSDERASLNVEVVTGLVPGIEFRIVQTEVFRSGGTPFVLEHAEARANSGAGYASGRRVAAFDLARGDYRVHVRLLRLDGSFLVDRTVAVTLANDAIVRVHITRDCVGVECPADGAAELSTCLAGRCVDPRCSEERHEFCPTLTFCGAPAECRATSSCAQRSCVDGICIPSTLPDACSNDEWCNPDVGAGCLPTVPVGRDAFPCGTICTLPDQPCRFGYWTCAEGAEPVCDSLANRPASVVCAAGRVCDSTGECVVETSEPVPGVLVAPTSGLVTTEGGGTATFTVVLATQPTSSVLIAIQSDDASEGRVTPGLLTFSSLNWDEAQTVTITGMSDSEMDGNVMYNVQTLAAASTDDDYRGIDPADVSVLNVDLGTPQIIVSRTSGIETDESGATDAFTMQLNFAPASSVSIALSSSDTGEGTVSPNSVTFTPSDWNVPRMVTITGVDDSVVDGDQFYSVITGAAVGIGSGFGGVVVPDIDATNHDNDVAAIVVAPTSGLITTELGATATFAMHLATQPSSSVSIALSSDNTAEGTVSPSSVTFTTANWNIDRTVTVHGVDDAAADGAQTFHIITAAAVSTDTVYAGLNPSDVTVTNSDNEPSPKRISVTPATVAVRTDTMTPAAMAVTLAVAPSADVTVSVTSSDPTEGVVAPATLVFTPSNWNVEQDVMLSPSLAHTRGNGVVAYSVTYHVAASADAEYLASPDQVVAATTLDPQLELVSGGIGGTQGNAAAGYFFATSYDGNVLAFDSDASNLVTGDTNGVTDVFVRDLNAGTTTRVSVSSAGLQGNGFSNRPSISSDGRYVAFTSNANNLVAGDTNALEDVFVHDRTSGTTTRVSVTNAGAQGTGYAYASGPSLSADGQVVAFYSNSPNLVGGDTNSAGDIFVRNLTAGTTVRASVSDMGGQITGPNGSYALSRNGRYVLFGATTPDVVVNDFNGNYDAFLRDLQLGTTELVGLTDVNTHSTNATFLAGISADGRYVAFIGQYGRVTQGQDPSNQGDQLFLRDRVANTTLCISRSDGGAYGGSGAFGLAAFSDNGRFVTFASNSRNLVTTDTTANTDTFLYDLENQRLTRISHTELGAELPMYASANAGAVSGDGSTYFLYADDSVSSIDTNGVSDIFVNTAPFDTTILPSLHMSTRYVRTTEDGTPTSTIYVRLTTMPTSNVVVNVVSDDVSESTVSVPTLTFTPSNWMTEQIVTVAGVNDGLFDGTISHHIVFSVGSTLDTTYAGVASRSVDVDTLDDEASIICASCAPSGVTADGISYWPALSSDGRYVAFASTAPNLVAGDTNAVTDVFRHDNLTGTTIRASLTDGGAQASYHSPYNGLSMSADGRFITFDSGAIDFVAGDLNGYRDIFMRDVTLNTTIRVDVATGGAESNLGANAPAPISGDGRFVVFSSGGSNLVAGDTNGVVDVFLRDTMLGVTTRVSVDSAGVQADSASAPFGSYSPAISADGRYVAFTSHASNLVANDTNGCADVFLRDTMLGVTTRVSLTTAGVEGMSDTGATIYTVVISSDGRYVAFTTHMRLDSLDMNGNADAYIHDVVTGTTRLVSLDEAGGAVSRGVAYGMAISDSGRYAAFTTDEIGIDPLDASGYSLNAFVHDSVSGTTRLVDRNLFGNVGDSATGNMNVVMSADGSTVAFHTWTDTHVLHDNNATTDIFVRPRP